MKTIFIWLGGLVVCGFVGALISEYFGERPVLGLVIGLVAFAFFKLLVLPERTDRYGTGGFDE
ncbi:putative membrane protein YfcA [Nitrobacter vulgaris]|uniref:hypothetical protein n=1 Tax=Nitrobacter vulgaris TaxID=29421 RepID=UPI00285A06F2|nr:hypothetical protein [Nitrobacter vulgaris]MDR6302743.1 putative membrane protein YfcA [Nitrobacter vulgaris]